MSAYASLPGLLLKDTWGEIFFLLLTSGRVKMPQRQRVEPAMEERRFWYCSFGVGLSLDLLFS